MSVLNDHACWQIVDKQIVKKIKCLIKDTFRNPFSSMQKPELSIGNYQGCWSRRITQEHRLVYIVDDPKISILNCRFHY